jgi:hypothetical protein
MTIVIISLSLCVSSEEDFYLNLSFGYDEILLTSDG